MSESVDSAPLSGRISDDPEGFIVSWLRARAQDVEDGHYSLEGITQSWPADQTFTFTVELRFESKGPPDE